MNKKIFWGVKIVIALLVTAIVITIDITQKGKVKKPDTPVLLRAYTDPYGAYGRYGEEPMGWFGDLLKDKLNIEVQIEPYPLLFGYEGDGDTFVKDADLYSFLGEISYYEAVQEENVTAFPYFLPLKIRKKRWI